MLTGFCVPSIPLIHREHHFLWQESKYGDRSHMPRYFCKLFSFSFLSSPGLPDSIWFAMSSSVVRIGQKSNMLLADNRIMCMHFARVKKERYIMNTEKSKQQFLWQGREKGSFSWKIKWLFFKHSGVGRKAEEREEDSAANKELHENYSYHIPHCLQEAHDYHIELWTRQHFYKEQPLQYW